MEDVARRLFLTHLKTSEYVQGDAEEGKFNGDYKV
jgi:hypothetical protein